MATNGWRTAGARADALLDQLHDLAAEEERHRRLLLLAATAAMALHALLLAFAPRPRGESPPIRLELDRFVLAPTPRFNPAPPAPEPPVARAERRVPIPDPTPDAPEPLTRTDAPVVPFDVRIVDDAPVIPVPPEPEPTIHVVGGEVAAPVKLHAPPPVYPRAALLAHREATVLLDAVIDAEGRVVELRPLTAQGFGFEEAALAAAREWRYRPATRRGEPVAVRLRLSVEFRIGG